MSKDSLIKKETKKHNYENYLLLIIARYRFEILSLFISRTSNRIKLSASK